MGGVPCNYPNCDCYEWFHQIALLLVGQEPGWRSPLLGDWRFHSPESVRAILSKEFLDMWSDPDLHQLKTRISWSDPSSCGCGEGKFCNFDDDAETRRCEFNKAAKKAVKAPKEGSGAK